MKAFDDIRQRMEQYKDEMLQKHRFVAEDFIRVIEPCFIRHGYRTKMPSQPRNLLIIHDAGVGDFINLSPCLRAIRQRYQAAHIVLVMFPRAMALAEFCPYVDEVIANARQCDWQSFTSLYEWNENFIERLLPYHFDLAFAFPHYGSAVMLTYLSGAKLRVAYDSSRVKKSAIWAGLTPYEALVPFINQPVTYGRENIHAVERYLGVLDGFWGGRVQERSLETWCCIEDISCAEELLSEWLADKCPIYAVVMGGEAARKRWLPEKYAQLARLLQEDYPVLRFVLLGGGAIDEQEAQRFLKAYKDLHGNEAYVKNLVGPLNYRESAAVLDKCEAYIGNDTGTMHLAAALDKPILAPNCFPAEFSMEPDDAPSMFAPWQVPSVFIHPVRALDDCKPKQSESGCCHVNEVHCIGQIEVKTMRKGFEMLRKHCNSGRKDVLYVNQENIGSV